MATDTLLLLNRSLHIGAGFVGLIVAPVALLVRKGGDAHRRWGRVFFWAMMIAGATGLLAATVKGLTFLLLTGLFSMYLAGFGYRSLYIGRGSKQATTFDKVLAAVGFTVFAGTVVFGLWYGHVVALVFGGIGVFTTLRQLAAYLRPAQPKPGQWLLNHMSGFVGAYIAAISAFSANVLTFIPPPFNFLWPTLVLVPLLVLGQRRYKATFRKGIPAETLHEVRTA
jgi:uncharacterized membrane protein